MNPNPEREITEGALIDQALSRIELSDPPSGFASAVMVRVNQAPHRFPQEINWRAVALAALLAGSALAYALYRIFNWMGNFFSPVNILRLQLELWYWFQSARLSWLSWQLNPPDLASSLQGAPLLAAGMILAAAGLLLCLGLWLALKNFPKSRTAVS